MKRISALVVVLVVVAAGSVASASDLRHLRFASTPAQAAAAPAVASEGRGAVVYSLTGGAARREVRPSPGVANTWVVGSGQFRPGK